MSMNATQKGNVQNTRDINRATGPRLLCYDLRA